MRQNIIIAVAVVVALAAAASTVVMVLNRPRSEDERRAAEIARLEAELGKEASKEAKDASKVTELTEKLRHLRRQQIEAGPKADSSSPTKRDELLEQFVKQRTAAVQELLAKEFAPAGGLFKKDPARDRVWNTVKDGINKLAGELKSAASQLSDEELRYVIAGQDKHPGLTRKMTEFGILLARQLDRIQAEATNTSGTDHVGAPKIK